MPYATTTITIQERRTLIRTLCRISTQSYPDTDLDTKIDIGDHEAQVWLQQPQTTDIDDTTIIVSNYITARNILIGIGGDDNIRAADQHGLSAKSLIEAYNGRAEEQDQATTQTYSSLNESINQDRDF